MTLSLVDQLKGSGYVCSEFDEGPSGDKILALCKLGGLCNVVEGGSCQVNPDARKGYYPIYGSESIALPIIKVVEVVNT